MNMNKRGISVTIGGVTFANPVFSASGIWGYGDEVASLVDVTRLGAVVTKTITIEPRPGNAPPRIHELATGLLNSIGLENVGLEEFIAAKLPAVAKAGITAIVSIAADREEQFHAIADRLARLDVFSGVEVNLSCPNVEKGQLDHGRDPRFVETITRAIKDRLPRRAVLVKLTPNLTDIGEVAAAAEAGGADGITAINTLLGADFDLGILPVALQKVWEVANAVSIPVVGVGGISSVDDARKFFLAGASAIQVGTQLFADPALADTIITALENNPGWMSRRKD
jgi:dihydroorotate dehydrogenase (NAD+) catalytic subunit